MSFTAPVDITPYLPASNEATFTPILPPAVFNVDQYLVEPGATVFSVTHGTSLFKVHALVTANIAWQKFKPATLTAADQVNPLQLQIAMIWFMNHVGRPYYGL